MPELRRITVLLLLILPGVAPGADASCGVPALPLCATWQQSYDAVFDGTVASIGRVDLPDTTFGSGRLVGHRLITFEVHDQWKGDLGRTVELLQYGGYEVASSNDFHAEKGVRYLIFARHYNGYLSTSSCDPSRRHADAAATIEMLNWARGPETGGRISVRAYRSYSPLAAPDAPALEASVELRGPAARTAVVGPGGFEFRDLPPGTYTLSASTKMPNVHANSPVVVEIPTARSCAAASFIYMPAASVSGQIVSVSGLPIEARVDLVAADSVKTSEPRRASAQAARADGRFAFQAVPPGRYLLALNYDDQMAYSPFQRTFFGTTGEAEVLDVRPGQHVDVGLWQVPEPLKRVRQKLRVLDPEGRPYANREIHLLDGRSETPDWRRHLMGNRTDDGGFVEFDVYEGRRYLVRGLLEQKPREPAQSATFEPQAGKLLTLMVKRER